MIRTKKDREKARRWYEQHVKEHLSRRVSKKKIQNAISRQERQARRKQRELDRLDAELKELDYVED